MRFGRVQGHGRRLGNKISIAVVLDAGNSARVVRDETVEWLTFGPPDDIVWQVDQLTQETIGTVLAAEGWEPISEETTPRSSLPDGLGHSAVYFVRNAGSSSSGSIPT